MSQQIAIATGDLNHQVAAIELASADRVGGQIVGIVNIGSGDESAARRPRVAPGLLRGRLGDLHQRTARANDQIQRIGRLLAIELVGRNKPAGQRRMAQRNNRSQAELATGTASAWACCIGKLRSVIAAIRSDRKATGRTSCYDPWQARGGSYSKADGRVNAATAAGRKDQKPAKMPRRQPQGREQRSWQAVFPA